MAQATEIRKAHAFSGGDDGVCVCCGTRRALKADRPGCDGPPRVAINDYDLRQCEEGSKDNGHYRRCRNPVHGIGRAVRRIAGEDQEVPARLCVAHFADLEPDAVLRPVGLARHGWPAERGVVKRPHIHYCSRARLADPPQLAVRGVWSRRSACGWWRERALLSDAIGEVTCGRCRVIVLA